MKYRHYYCHNRLLRVSRTDELAAKSLWGFVGVTLSLRNTLYIWQRIFTVAGTDSKGVYRWELTISRRRAVLSYRE